MMGGKFTLVAALDDEARELAQGIRRTVKCRKVVDRRAAEFLRPLLRRRHADDAWIRRLVTGAVGADRLAEHARIALDVEDVVLNLKGETDMRGELAKRSGTPRVETARREYGEPHARLDECAGLELVHGLELRDRELAADGGEIDRLAARHASGAAGIGQHVDHSRARLGVDPHRLVARENLEREDLQGVAYQNGGRLIEGAVTGRTAAPEVVVIHGREVIVDQRIRMDQLDGGSGPVQSGEVDAEYGAGRVDQYRPQAFARPEHAVAQRIVQARRFRRRRGQPAIENPLDARLAGGGVGGKIRSGGRVLDG